MTLRQAVASVPVLGPTLKALAKWYRQNQIRPVSELHEFWRTPEPEGNVPADYLAEEAKVKSKALLDLISDFPKDARILEVGCNAGRNIAYLYNAGYRNVEAIEISPHAVALLRKHYPELAGVTIHNEPAEEALPRFAARSFDLVFTMAVLEHIHPDSATVFDHMARIAKTILAIEPTVGSHSERQYPHDYDRLFESRGFKLVMKKPMTGIAEIGGFSAYRWERR